MRKHPFKHAILPIVAALIMLIPLSASFYPVPPAPYNYLPFIVLAYVIVGYLIVRRLARDPQRLKRVGPIFGGG